MVPTAERRRIVAIGVAALAVASIAASANSPLTVDDLMALRTVTDVRISPDGRHVAYVVSTPSFMTDAHEAELYLVPVGGGTAVRLASTVRLFNRPLPSTELRWSPDGSRVTFLAFDEGGLPQVFASDVSGGVASALTSAAGGVMTYEWSPDGTRLAYLALDPPPDAEEKQKREKTFVIEVGRQERAPRVWVKPIQGTIATAVTPPDQFVSGLSWAPDASQIAYSAATRPGRGAQFATRIHAVSPNGGPTRLIVDRPGMNTSPVYSPDGNWIAFTSNGGREEMLSIWGLHVVRTTGPEQGQIRDLSVKTQAWAGMIAWMPDSRSLIQVPQGETGRGERMFEQPLWRVSIENGEAEPLHPGPFVHFTPSVSRDGATLVYRVVEPRTMGDVEVMSLATKERKRITDVNPELGTSTLGELRAISWKSFDNTDVWGLLLTPPGYRAGTRIPLVVYCHGGPTGGFTYGVFPQFMHRPGQIEPYAVEALAAEGFAVLMPMPRGGFGYGAEGYRAIVKRWGVDDYKDIMAGVDHVIGQGIADPERLGVMGASYGGFMTPWILTQTDRFKAGSTAASVTDLSDMFYLSDMSEPMLEYFGLPWEHPDLYRQYSPVTHAANIKAPLLIQHGENDRRVPITQAWKLYEALRRFGKTVEFEIYPRAGHVVYEPDLQREQMRRNVEWFKRWLK
jgi:dipeptidyl aminopeptidase/acylaminoacyl peptidase